MTIEKRGVYLARHTIDGCQVLYAVMSNGDQLKPRIVLRPMVDRDAAADWLWQQLDARDPVPERPTLTLVREDLPHGDQFVPPPESTVAFAMRRAQQYHREGRIRRLV